MATRSRELPEPGAPCVVVAVHKAVRLPTDPLYLPVHVGSAAAREVLAGVQRDDVGPNISADNARYCELTGLHWAWRNVAERPLGLNHYRRYFSGAGPGPGNTRILSGEEARALLGEFDMVVARRRNYLVETIADHYAHAHVAEDLAVLEAVLGERFPHLVPAYRRVMARRSMSPFNMFLARREVADAYCAWLFEVLEEVDRRLDVSGRSAYQCRAVGFLGERLLNVWLEANPALRVTRRRVVHTEGEPLVRKALALLARRVSPAALRT